MHSFRGVKPTTNPYLVQLVRALSARDDVSIEFFNYPQALFGRYDVFHVHWPEVLVGGNKLMGRLARRFFTTLLLARITFTRTPVVRTWHNTERPEGLAAFDYWILDRFDAATKLRIRLNSTTELPDDALAVTVPLGHYIDWFRPYQPVKMIPGRVAYVGLIRRYKGVDALVRTFRSVQFPGASLTVAGKPSDAGLAQLISELAQGDERIFLNLTFINEDDFVSVLTAAEIIVLPFVHMHNSSTVLAALSLERPVLIPDNEVNRELIKEIGPGWIYLYESELDSRDIDSTLRSLRESPPTAKPNLDARGWEQIAVAHMAAYRLVLPNS